MAQLAQVVVKDMIEDQGCLCIHVSFGIQQKEEHHPCHYSLRILQTIIFKPQ